VAIPAEILRLVRAGRLEDTSWHNNVCPSFTVSGNTGVRLWVGEDNPADREVPGDRRFTVSLYEDDGTWLGVAESTDCVVEVLEYLADHWDVS
jgi:hypothetical protein